ncbi:MAG: PTS sugar transporter subunit IIA [Spirochaetales bacterium]|jgi:nitrogen PTS system EIIA component|nr:PTS sugar transporter subunit IIA [Spirochaetales bacterium]
MEKISCFTHGTVVCDLESSDKFSAIHELLRNAPVFRDVENIDYLERAVIQREQLQSTGLGNGIAVAHGKTPAVGNIVMALGISRNGIQFEAMDGLPVHFLFLVANPPGMQLEYLLALSVLIRVIRDDRFRDELLTCFDPFEIEKRLSDGFRASMIRRGYPFN